MTPNEAFLALAINDRRRIGYLTAVLSVVHIVQFLAAAPGTTLSPRVGAALNALAVYWCLLPERAPGFWFRLLPYGWWISAIFDGLEVSRVFSGRPGSQAIFALSAVNVCVLPFLAGPLLRFHRLSRTGEATADHG